MPLSRALPERDIFFITGLIHPDTRTVSVPGLSPEPNSRCYTCWGPYSAPRSPSAEVGPESSSPCKIAACGHWFCYSCIHGWLQEQRNSCPVCRRELFRCPPIKSVAQLERELDYLAAVMQQGLERKETPHLRVALDVISTMSRCMHNVLKEAERQGQPMIDLESRDGISNQRVLHIGKKVKVLFEIQGSSVRNIPSATHRRWSRAIENGAALNDAEMISQLRHMLYIANSLEQGMGF